MGDTKVIVFKEKSHNFNRITSNIKKDIYKSYQLYLLILLPVLYIIVFNYVPMVGVQIAFRDFKAIYGIFGSKWVGLEYFKKFFESYQFSRVLSNTLEISVYHLVAGFPIPIILSLALNNTKKIKFKKIVQMVTYAPHFISTVVMAGIILLYLSPKLGMINHAIELLGFQGIDFMGKPEWFSSVYVWSGIWQGAGWGTIIYLAALSSVEPTLHEAAIVDGASRLKRVIHIDIPGILPIMVILLILSMGQIMNVGFEKVLLLQNPLNLRKSEIIATYVYKVGLTGLPQYSYAAAIGLFNSIINFILIIICNQIAKKVGNTSLF